LIDPGADRGDLRGSQPLTLGRHDLVRVGSRNQADQQTLAGLSGHDGRPAVAAAKGVTFAIKPQSAALFLRPVARAATARKDWPNFFVEIGRRLSRDRAGRGEQYDPNGAAERAAGHY
jgi:hypothetical protein